MTPKVLVALSQDFIGISRLPRILKQGGIDVSVLSAPDFCIQSSRFVGDRIPSSREPVEAVEALRLHLQSVSTPYSMVILGDDLMLEQVAQRCAEPWAAALLPLDLGRIDCSCAFSKLTFSRMCEAAGLPVPQSTIGSTLSDAQAAAAAIGYPLIFKEDTGFSGSGVFKVENAQELEALFNRRKGNHDWVMQAEIKGRVATVDVLFNRGVPVAWVCSYAVCTRNGPFGSSSVRQFFNLAEVQPLLAKLGQASGAQGLIGVDFIHEQPSGRVVLLEMNCRPTAGHSIAKQAGVDFGKALARQLRGESAAHQTPISGELVVPMFPEDIDRVITDKDFGGFCRWVFFPSYWHCMPWSDPRLLVRHIAENVGRLGNWALRTTRLKS